MRTESTLVQTDHLPRNAPGLWTELSDTVARFRRELFGSYRPERHYMRGPGPACRAKRTLAGPGRNTYPIPQTA